MSDSESDRVELLATTAFGLEAVAAREISDLGYEPKILSTGRVLFSGDASAISRANINLRTVDRVLLRVATFPAPDFEALFEGVKAVPWERWIPRDAEFPVNGRTVKSQLTSLPAVQRATKRAIVDRLMSAHRTTTLPETGPRFIVEIGLLENVATLTLDTSGDGLHKRGYRDLVGDASLKETMAAGLVLLSVWNRHRPLIDPFCGTGTIAIEAAMIGLGIAPGLTRQFDAEHWPTLPERIWDDAQDESRGWSLVDSKRAMPTAIQASDINERALEMSRRHAIRAGVDRFIHFTRRDFREITSSREYGCIIANPPYGQRLGDEEEIERLYLSFPEVLKRFPTWSHFVLTARNDLEMLVGQEATRRRKLYNAQIECTYFQFLGLRPPDERERRREPEGAASGDEVIESDASRTDPFPGEQPTSDGEPTGHETADPAPCVPAVATSVVGACDVSADGATDAVAVRPPAASTARIAEKPAQMPAFGGLRERDRREIDEFEGRLAKRARHLRKWPSRGITCYRLYERDCPDVPVVVDRYEDAAHIFEYEREHGRTLAQHLDWLDEIARRTAKVLEIPFERVHVKSRPKQRGLTQHEKLGDRGGTMTVREGGLRFLVNLTDYTDTGLFLDHRITRGMVRDLSRGARFLNLFCYTGAFTVYAAAGGASETTSVDLSNTYLDWAARNMRENGLIDDTPGAPARHRFVQSDVIEFLTRQAERAGAASRGLYDLAVVDPPTFSNSKRTEEDWEVQRGHADVLGLLLPLMSPGGVVFFSTNYRRFKFDDESIARVRPGTLAQEISAKTVPEDFRNERIHRCWKITVP
jgi:23S rRNA (guanine2445-N2)-methyltransferase / 23S rRNA (guanine2069-N7)-methyltransferase